ncbi:WecB/TagA/CpsF family glycosyltransferase [Arthrobacter pascens]
MTEPTKDDAPGWQGETVLISGLSVADATQQELVDWLSSQRNPAKPLLAYALHVGGLVALRENDKYRKTMDKASVIYADGIGPVLLGRSRGGRLGRSATTDIAPELLRRWAREGEPPRIALLGGPPGLASAAGHALSDKGLGKTVYAESGFQANYDVALASIKTATPDVLFVGMGAPREMEWCENHYLQLPDCVVITCGGWFGFLTGKERRAPRWVQRAGGEWVWRLAQSPSRLFGRYFKGLLVLGHELVKRTS